MGVVRDVFISGIQPQRNLPRTGLGASTHMVIAALLRKRISTLLILRTISAGEMK